MPPKATKRTLEDVKKISVKEFYDKDEEIVDKKLSKIRKTGEAIVQEGMRWAASDFT